ncbi:flavin reductase family protein [Streptomyces sp. SID11385]|uniref:flavin reductase family protein n=1 Tax=Streptomyces sp. SID11385 TaxID=2706031 RepID=UPI0031BA21D2
MLLPGPRAEAGRRSTLPWSPWRRASRRRAGPASGRPGSSASTCSAPAPIECELTGAYDAGDHELVIGRVLEIGTRPGKPLLFYRGAFSRLGV